LRAKTHPLTLEETHAYIVQRLRIAGCNGRTIFEPAAMDTIHRYAGGIPRVINLLCEHALVSSFVDQQPIIVPDVIEAVARDFDMGENATPGTNGNGNEQAAAAAAAAGAQNFDLLEALKTLATLADRLRQSEQEAPKERKL
jgi:hypothetical protein